MDQEWRENKRDKINRIFKPWGGFGYESYTIYGLLDHGLLSFNTEKIEILEMPNEEFRDYECAFTETLPHINLKYTASKLLYNLGEEAPAYEYKTYDVFSPKLKLRIECGHTEPDRLLHCIVNDIKFWLLQYPDQNEEEAILYKFTPTKECKDVVKRYLAMQMSSVGKLLLEQYGTQKKQEDGEES